MKVEDYEAMLLAVAQALEICEHAETFSDAGQRELCQELRAIQARLLELVASSSSRSDPEENHGNGFAGRRPKAIF